MRNIKKIQNWIKKNNIDFFILNRSDEFLNEYLAPYAERLNWVSNFTGSAGRLIILQNEAIIFTDGRYITQVKKQVDEKYFINKHINKYWNWLENHIKKNTITAVDTNLHSIFEINKLKNLIKSKKSTLEFLSKNPIDLFWKNQPGYPKAKAFIHHVKYAGQSRESKIN